MLLPFGHGCWIGILKQIQTFLKYKQSRLEGLGYKIRSHKNTYMNNLIYSLPSLFIIYFIAVYIKQGVACSPTCI